MGGRDVGLGLINECDGKRREVARKLVGDLKLGFIDSERSLGQGFLKWIRKCRSSP